MAKVRWGRVIAAALVLSGAVFIGDGLRRDMRPENMSKIAVNGDFVSNGDQKAAEGRTDETVVLGATQNASEFTGVQNLGFAERDLPKDKLGSGRLAVINDEHPAGEPSAEKKVSLVKYKNEFYTLADESLKLNEEAAEALNRMMADYNEATGLSDFMAYGTTNTYTGEGSLCPEKFPESVTGNTIDLALNAYGSVLNFDGYDEEGWVVENCAKYGFIVRYPEGKKAKTGHNFCPWHLRYVGEVHSAIMDEKKMCLEEYVDFLKAYSFDNSFQYTLNGAKYEIYTVAASAGESTIARVPVSGKYDVSGDNIGTYVITTEKN